MEGAGIPSAIRRLPVKKKTEAIILTTGISRDATFEFLLNFKLKNFSDDRNIRASMRWNASESTYFP